MSIPIKAQVYDMHMGECKWESAMVLCDGSLYLADGWGKMYAVDRTYFGQVMKEFLNAYLTRHNEARRLRNNLLREGKHVEAELTHRKSVNIEKDIVELKKVWSAFKSFSKRNKKKDSSEKPPVACTSKITFTWQNYDGKKTVKEVNDCLLPSFWS